MTTYGIVFEDENMKMQTVNADYLEYIDGVLRLIVGDLKDCEHVFCIEASMVKVIVPQIDYTEEEVLQQIKEYKD